MITRIKRESKKGPIFLVFILLAAFGAVGTYFYLYPESLPEWATKTSVGRDMQTTTVYKWQDASGAWHVSDQPPQAGIEYKVESYTRDTNVLPVPPKLQR